MNWRSLGPLGCVAMAAALFSNSLSARVPEGGVRERVDVTLRTVWVVVFDEKDNPASARLAASDLRLFEDGKPVEIIAVERLQDLAQTRGSVALPLPLATRSEPSPVKSVIWIDTALVQRGAAERAADDFARNIESLLQTGPVTVAVADQKGPHILVDSSRDPATVRAALRAMARFPADPKALLQRRRDLMDEPAPAVGWKVRARGLIDREAALIEERFEMVRSWMTAHRGAAASILYLVNDGFDLEPADFYFNCRNVCPPETIMEWDSLRRELLGRVPSAVERLGRDLASLGVISYPMAVGGLAIHRSQVDVEIGRGRAWGTSAAPSQLAYDVRPLGPLHKVARDTGGEVIADLRGLRRSLGQLSSALLITFRSLRGIGSGTIAVETAQPRSNLRLRAARRPGGGSEVLIQARQDSPHESTDSALTPLEVSLSVEPNERLSGGRTSGTLIAVVDLVEISSIVPRHLPLRVRLVVWVESTRGEPWVQTEEVDIRRVGDGSLWTWEAPFQWPKDARRVVLTIEELTTGGRGRGEAILPALDTVEAGD